MVYEGEPSKWALKFFLWMKLQKHHLQYFVYLFTYGNDIGLISSSFWTSSSCLQLSVPLLCLQFSACAWLLQHQHGNHQLLHQSHNPLLCIQEVQKLLQGKIKLCFLDECCMSGTAVVLFPKSAWLQNRVTGSEAVRIQQGHTVKRFAVANILNIETDELVNMERS